MTLLVKCEACGYEFQITPDEICYGIHEDFVSCRNPQTYIIGDRPKKCSGCIPIPYEIDLRKKAHNVRIRKET